MKIKKNKKPIIIGNWKSSTPIYKEAEKNIIDLYKDIDKFVSKIDLYIAPMSSHIQTLYFYFNQKISFAKEKKKKLPKIQLVAQDISFYEKGSHTGEIIAESAKDMGVKKVILGHSECRERGDTDIIILQKIKNALAQKLDIVLCIGEKERDDGIAYFKKIENQINQIFDNLDKKDLKKIILAYEPVWAINNKENKSLDAHGIHSMILYIKKFLYEKYGEENTKDIFILYGGSVNAENVQDIYWNGEVDGLLIGRGSFTPVSFSDIIKNILINPKKNIVHTYGNKK